MFLTLTPTYQNPLWKLISCKKWQQQHWDQVHGRPECDSVQSRLAFLAQGFLGRWGLSQAHWHSPSINFVFWVMSRIRHYLSNHAEVTVRAWRWQTSPQLSQGDVGGVHTFTNTSSFFWHINHSTFTSRMFLWLLWTLGQEGENCNKRQGITPGKDVSECSLSFMLAPQSSHGCSLLFPGLCVIVEECLYPGAARAPVFLPGPIPPV